MSIDQWEKYIRNTDATHLVTIYKLVQNNDISFMAFRALLGRFNYLKDYK